MCQSPSWLVTCLTREAEFVISKDFVNGAGVQDRQCSQLFCDGINLLHIDWTRRTAKLRFERANHGVGKSYAHFLANPFGESMGGGILDVQRSPFRFGHTFIIGQSSGIYHAPGRRSPPEYFGAGTEPEQPDEVQRGVDDFSQKPMMMPTVV